MLELGPENLQLMFVAVIAIGLAVVIYVIAYPYISGDAYADKRLQSVTENKAVRSQRRARDEEVSNRRKQVADTLKDLEDRQQAKEKITLRVKLQRAGLEITPNVFWISSLVSGLVIGLVTYISATGITPLASVGAFIVGAFGLPQWVLKLITKRRFNRFTNEFANAIDVIVRGVKSGLPLNECLGIIARESPSPIREEFQELVEQSRVGIPLQECFERMMQRVPLPEMKFFAIVIGIQQQAGGNLSEALGNLSGVLRDRKKLSAKVKALSAEAKASAAVLGALPFIVMVMVYISTPDYILILFRTKVGQFLLLAAGCWMTCGVLIMRKMINFKY